MNEDQGPAQQAQPKQCIGEQPIRCGSPYRRLIVHTLLFAVVYSILYWITGVQPYATLPVKDDNFILFSPDSSTLVTAAIGKGALGKKRGPLRVWDVVNGIERFSVATDWQAIETVLFTPASSLLAAHEQEGDLKLWNAKTGDEVATINTRTHAQNWVNFRFSPDGEYLVFQDYSQGWPDKDYVTFWHIPSKREQGSVESYFGTLAFASGGKSFATFRRKDYNDAFQVLLWNVRPSQAPTLEKDHRISAREVAFAPDLRRFATGKDLPDGNGEVALWDMATGKTIVSMKFDEGDTHLQSLSFEADGRILSANGGGGTKLNWHWHTTLWNVSSTLREIGSFSERPAISPNGNWLAEPLEAGARLIQVSTLERKGDLTNNDDAGPLFLGLWNGMKSYPSSTFSPDSKIVAIQGLFKWGKEPSLSKWLPDKVTDFLREPSGSLVRLWDVTTRQEIMVFPQCNEAHLSPNGRTIATHHQGQRIDLWAIPFSKPHWRILCQAVLVWMGAILIIRLAIKVRRGKHFG